MHGLSQKKLRDYKQEIEDSFKSIMDERPNDEVHCTCVPFLKIKIKELETDCDIYLSQNKFLQERLEEEKQKNKEARMKVLVLEPQNAMLIADRDNLEVDLRKANGEIVYLKLLLKNAPNCRSLY